MQTSPRVSAETCQLPGGMVARGSVVGSVVVDEPFKKKARNPLDGGHSEASYQSCDDDLGADYDRDSPHASGDEAEAQAQLADLRYEKECSLKELAVARAKCKAAADELVRLRDENEKLTISNAELFDDLGELEAQMGKRPDIKDVLDVMRSGGWEEHSPAHTDSTQLGGFPQGNPPKAVLATSTAFGGFGKPNHPKDSHRPRRKTIQGDFHCFEVYGVPNPPKAVLVASKSLGGLPWGNPASWVEPVCAEHAACGPQRSTDWSPGLGAGAFRTPRKTCSWRASLSGGSEPRTPRKTCSGRASLSGGSEPPGVSHDGHTHHIILAVFSHSRVRMRILTEFSLNSQ